MYFEQYPYTSTGTIIYDPPRPPKLRRNVNWCIIEADPDIAEYYRCLFNMTFMTELLPASWDSHISIIRGEKEVQECPGLWKKYHGQSVTFRYNNNFHCNNTHVWINTYAPITKQIRMEYELPNDWQDHLTIGCINPKRPFTQYILDRINQ